MTGRFVIEDHLIPLESGQAVGQGWTTATQGMPMGVTWHWTVTRDLATCTRVLGGASAERKGVASAHYAVGRSHAEGVHRYVALENRSWHAGINQTLDWQGRPSTAATKGSRATIGIETVNLGYARPGLAAGPDWIRAASSDGRTIFHVQPWTEEQIEMMIAVGKAVVERWNHIGVRSHHGHHDICPGYKDDVAGFPFARVLSGIYEREVPDVWGPLWLPRGRQQALHLLDYDIAVDGLWGQQSDRVLRQFQNDANLVANGRWSTFVCWAIHDRLQEKRRSLADLV